MKSYLRPLLQISLLVLVALTSIAVANASTDVNRRISRQLRNLPYYSLFDNLSFETDGSKVTLHGQVWWPNLKNSAERVVAKIEGITGVDNQIEVLPTSFYDDRLRLAIANALFSNGALGKYVRPGVSFGLLPHRSDIHIIVKNGEVILEGVVLSKGDSAVARIVANSVSGVFSVTNNLRVEKRKA